MARKDGMEMTEIRRPPESPAFSAEHNTDAHSNAETGAVNASGRALDGEGDMNGTDLGRKIDFSGLSRVRICGAVCCLLIFLITLAALGASLQGGWVSSTGIDDGATGSQDGNRGPTVELAPPAGMEGIKSVIMDLVRDLTEGAGKGAAWDMTAEFVDTFGHRLAGSDNLENSIDWLADRCRRAGFDRVYHENVTIPKWTRGEENATLMEPLIGGMPKKLSMLGLGFSPPAEGIEAEVLVVSSWVELGEQGETAEGKIVLLNPPFKGYSQTVAYRTFGATLAAKLGAVAVLVRSVTPFSISSPHTGSQSRPQSISAEWAQRMGVPPLFVGNYSDVPQIPAAALAAEDTALLARLQARGRRVRVRLHMGAQNWGDVTSRNTIVELEGTVRPDEVVIFGGHIDSWDVGQGAIDDAGPSLVCLQAVLAMLRSGLRPYRTIRLVFFTAEEIGLYGGSQHYANQLAQGVDKVHLVAELDHGIFNPVGISLQAELQVMQVAIYTASLIAATGATQVVSRRTSLSDLNDFPSKHNVPSMSLIMVPNNVFEGQLGSDFQGDYFLYHHTHGDTVDRLVPEQMDRAAAAMSAHIYAFATMPQRSLHSEPSAYSAPGSDTCGNPRYVMCPLVA